MPLADRPRRGSSFIDNIAEAECNSEISQSVNFDGSQQSGPGSILDEQEINSYYEAEQRLNTEVVEVDEGQRLDSETELADQLDQVSTHDIRASPMRHLRKPMRAMMFGGGLGLLNPYSIN